MRLAEFEYHRVPQRYFDVGHIVPGSPPEVLRWGDIYLVPSASP